MSIVLVPPRDRAILAREVQVGRVQVGMQRRSRKGDIRSRRGLWDPRVASSFPRLERPVCKALYTRPEHALWLERAELDVLHHALR